MIDIVWKVFEIKHAKATEAFETLSKERRANSK